MPDKAEDLRKKSQALEDSAASLQRTAHLFRQEAAEARAMLAKLESDQKTPGQQFIDALPKYSHGWNHEHTAGMVMALFDPTNLACISAAVNGIVESNQENLRQKCIDIVRRNVDGIRGDAVADMIRQVK